MDWHAGVGVIKFHEQVMMIGTGFGQPWPIASMRSMTRRNRRRHCRRNH